VTALEWVNPENDDVIGQGYVLNVSDDSHSDHEVILYHSPQDEDNFQEFDTDTESESIDGTNYWTGQLEDEGSGSYTVLANLTNGTNTEDTAEIDLTKDQGGPDVRLGDSERDYVDVGHEIRVVAEDSTSNIDDVSAYADDREVLDEQNVDCASGEKCRKDFQLDTDNLNSGAQIDLTLEAVDQVGNTGSDSKTVTLDTSYQASAPKIDGFDVDVESGVASVNGDVEVNVNVPNIDDETSDAMQIECIVDDDTVDTTSWESSNDFECELPFEDIQNQEVDVEVRACDRVNHCQKSDITTVTFDASDPEVERFETVQDYKVFGDDFEVEYEASDEATSIENVQYFFSSAFNEGEGYEADAEDGKFNVDTSKLSGDSNERTLYIRVQDESGRWSQIEEVSQVDFEYYPEAQPRVSLNAPENLTLVSGQSKELEIDVENPGKLRLGKLTVSLESEITDSSEVVEGLEGGETVDISFDLSPNESHLGVSEAEISSDGPLHSKDVTFLVNANEDQKEQVSRKIESYSTKLENIESNISKLRNQGLKSELNKTIVQNTSDFEKMVVSAQNFVEEEKYHKAYKTLENIEKVYNKANRSYSEVEQQHELNKRNEKFMFAGLAVLMLSLGGMYYTRSSDFEYDLADIGLEMPENVDIPSLPEDNWLKSESLSFRNALNEFSIGEKIGEKVESAKKFIEKEEEEVEQGFEGFR